MQQPTHLRCDGVYIKQKDNEYSYYIFFTMYDALRVRGRGFGTSKMTYAGSIRYGFSVETTKATLLQELPFIFSYLFTNYLCIFP